MVGEETEVEVVTKTEYIYEDTQCVSVLNPSTNGVKYID